MKSRLIALAASAAVLLGISSCFATEAASPSDAASMEGIWVSYTGLQSARFEMETDGVGFLAIDTGATVLQYQVAPDESGVGGFVAKPIGQTGPAHVSMRVSGAALLMKVSQDDYHLVFSFGREESAAAEADKLKQSVGAIRASP